ncbi:Abc transporter c family member 2, partial [Globisporangium polare]
MEDREYQQQRNAFHGSDLQEHYWVLPVTPRPEKHPWYSRATRWWRTAIANRQRKPDVAELYAHQASFRERPNPLQSASLASVVSTHWMQPLISLGAHKVLEKDDVWPVCPQDSCDELVKRFAVEYEPQKRAWLGVSRVGLALFKTFKNEFIVVFASLFLYVAAMALQPTISQAILDHLDDRENAFHIQSGYVLVVMMTVVSLLGVTCLNYGVFVLSRVGVNMRSIMMDIVYQKALRLSCVGRQAYTTGEIVTLMSVDSERIFNSVLSGPWLVVAPLAFIITIVLIASLFDVVSALCGAALLVIVLFVSKMLATRIGELQGELLKVVEERVKVTSEALQGIRVMKFYAWEDSLAQRVQKIRAREIRLYRKFHCFQVMNTTLLFLTPVLLGGLILGVYVQLRGNLTVTEVFTLIATVNISRLAVNMFPLAIAATSQLRVTLQRLDRYFDSDELSRLANLAQYASAPTSLTATVSFKRSESKSHMPPNGSITVQNGLFEWSRQKLTSPFVMVMRAMPTGSAPTTVNHPRRRVDTIGGHSMISRATSAPGTIGFYMECIDLHIDPGSLVMIVGSVGSGKSSLLSALLGEMVVVEGAVSVQGEVSYVSQEAWIRNSSVKDNILFESAFDAHRYRKVLKATQLPLDLQALPDGDETEIGERGINLSGGQKARVAIARAMYRSHYDILMMDDPLSAVDAHVARAIFSQCIMRIAKHKTRVLVLNSHYDLLKYADKVFVLEEGRLVGNGSYREVVAQFPDLEGTRHRRSRLDQPHLVHRRHSVHAVRSFERHLNTDDTSDNFRGGHSTNSVAHEPSCTTVEQHHQHEREPHVAHATLVQDEDRVKGKVSGHTYKAYFDETGFNGLAVISVLVAAYSASQVLRILVDWWQGHWAEDMVRDGVDPTYSALWFGMWYLSLIVLCSVLTIARSLLMIESCIRSAKHIHDELFRRVLQAPVNLYFDITPVGRILNRFSNDLDQLDANLPHQCQNLLQSLVVFLGCLGVCTMASFWVGLSYLPLLAVFVFTGLHFKKTSREVKRLEGITRTPVYSLFGETFNGLHTIRAFKMQEKFERLNKAAVDTNASFYFMYRSAGSWLAVRLDWLSAVTIFVVSFYLVFSKGQSGSVAAGISLTYSLMLTSMVQWVVRAADITDNAMTSVERLLHFRSIPAEDDGASCTPINREIWPSQGSIKFDNLCLKYRP